MESSCEKLLRLIGFSVWNVLKYSLHCNQTVVLALMRYVTVTTVDTDTKKILVLFVKFCYTVWKPECDVHWVLRENVCLLWQNSNFQVWHKINSKTLMWSVDGRHHDTPILEKTKNSHWFFLQGNTNTISSKRQLFYLAYVVSVTLLFWYCGQGSLGKYCTPVLLPIIWLLRYL